MKLTKSTVKSIFTLFKTNPEDVEQIIKRMCARELEFIMENPTGGLKIDQCDYDTYESFCDLLYRYRMKVLVKNVKKIHPDWVIEPMPDCAKI